MKVRYFLQAAACCTLMFSAPLANAADVSYSNAEQRIRVLEERINTLEAAKSNPVSQAGFLGYETGCGDSVGCGSGCGDNVGCGSSCGNGCSSCWLNPGCFSQFDAEVLLFAVSDSEAEAGDGQDRIHAGVRFTYSRYNDAGQIFRIRYMNFGSTLTGGNNRYEMEKFDTVVGKRFTLGGGIQGELTGGIRYASFYERNHLDYDTTFGPLLGVHIRGREILRGTSFATFRQSWQFGDARENGAAKVPGTFDITEVQLGVEWSRPTQYGDFVLKTAFEIQYWSGVQEADTEDIGLYGVATSFGLAF